MQHGGVTPVTRGDPQGRLGPTTRTRPERPNVRLGWSGLGQSSTSTSATLYGPS